MKHLVLTAKERRFKKTIPDKLWSGPTMFSTLTSDERTQLVGILTRLAATRRDAPSTSPDASQPD